MNANIEMYITNLEQKIDEHEEVPHGGGMCSTPDDCTDTDRQKQAHTQT